jgi:plastocyanin
MKKTFLISKIFLLVILISFAESCGKSGGSSNNYSNGGGGGTTGKSITIYNYSFPALTTTAGTTVTWTNKDPVTHTVTSDDGVSFNATVASGATFSYTFANKGTFSYHCNIHTSMHGTVTVQ